MKPCVRRKYKFKKFIPAGIAACLTLFITQNTIAATSCKNMQEWFLARKQIVESSTKDARSRTDAQKAEWDARTFVAKNLVIAYFDSENGLQEINSCLEGLNGRQNFFNTLQSQLFQESMLRLRKAKSPILKRIIQELDQRFGPNSATLFRMTGHLPHESSPTNEKGGFHRGSKSIFMDVSRIPPNEWLLIFSHELLHSLDPMLFDAIRDYNQPQLLERIGTEAQRRTHPKQLSAENYSELTKWLEAGLGRGLWAEYRAWTVTLALYEEGLQEGIWQRISWMDQILEERRSGEKLDLFTYRYLDAKSINPSEGIFSRPLVQEALKEVRERYRNGPAPLLGMLGCMIGRAFCSE